MKWIWNDMKPTIDPMKHHANLPGLPIVHATFCSARGSAEASQYGPASVWCSHPAHWSSTWRSVSIIPFRLPKSVVACGGYRWWYEYYWNPLCSDVLFIYLRTFHREICQMLIILTHKVAVAEIYSAFGPFLLAVFDADCLVPFEWGPAQEYWTLISP